MYSTRRSQTAKRSTLRNRFSCFLSLFEILLSMGRLTISQYPCLPLLSVFVACLFCPLLDAVRVTRTTLPLGSLQGVACPDFAEVTQYLGVPYALPPVGSLRFRPPLPDNRTYPKPALKATTPPPPCGSICFKAGNEADRSLSSEDCLFLNLWVPREAQQAVLERTAPVAVRVYIHGGMQTRCSASDPHKMGCPSSARTGTIQVNLQYRTGVFGLLAHPATWTESNTTGNWAIMDEQLALRWVQDNIHFFGGDPKQVMIFGNSAGGQAVAVHTVAPASAGLFSAAIAQSAPCTELLSLEQAYRVSRRALTAANCIVGSMEEQLACMRSVPWSTLSDLTEIPPNAYKGCTMCAGASWEPTFQPCVDGQVLPYPLLHAIRLGKFHKVPYLMGYNKDEGRNFVLSFILGSPENVNNDTFLDLVEDVYPGADARSLLRLYHLDFFAGDSQPQLAQVSQLYTDIFFACPVHAILSARSSYNVPSWLYHFTVTPSCPRSSKYLLSSHTAELFYVFGYTRSLPPPGGNCNLSPAEEQLSRIMLHAWASMARSQSPEWLDGRVWDTWEPATQLAAIFAKSHSGIGSVNLGERCGALELAKAQWANGVQVDDNNSDLRDHSSRYPRVRTS